MKKRCNRCHGKRKVLLGKNRIPCPVCCRSRKRKSSALRVMRSNPISEIRCDYCGKVKRGGKFYTKHDGTTYCSKKCAKAAKKNPGFLETAAHLGSIAASAQQLMNPPTVASFDQVQDNFYPNPYDGQDVFTPGRRGAVHRSSQNFNPNPYDGQDVFTPGRRGAVHRSSQNFNPNPMPRRRFPRTGTLQFDDERSRYYSQNPPQKGPLGNQYILVPENDGISVKDGLHHEFVFVARYERRDVAAYAQLQEIIDRAYKRDQQLVHHRIMERELQPTSTGHHRLAWAVLPGSKLESEVTAFLKSIQGTHMMEEGYTLNPPATMPSGGSFNTSAASYRKHYGWKHGKHRGWTHRKKKHAMYGNRGKKFMSAFSKPGSKGYLRRALGIKADSTIPFKKLMAAKKQKKNERLRRAAINAIMLRKYRKHLKKR